MFVSIELMMRNTQQVYKHQTQQFWKTKQYFTLLLLLFFPYNVAPFASFLQCYIEFDEEEVIMHHHIIPVHQSRHKVNVQVQPYDDGSTEWKNNFTLSSDPITLKVKLEVPAEIDGLNVEFVVEATNAEFIGRGVMCGGNRAFSKRHDKYVVLKIIDTSQDVTLEAIYAKGYEAVTLTPKLTLSAQSGEIGTEEL